jgi:Uncharacterized conserved protein related to C-terminal domain of eukaryotic chaperone, SACSIN
MNDKVTYWVNIAKYDIETADVMLKSKRLLYVGFMCHQAIEKILKAYYCTVSDDAPPYVHDLDKLAVKSDIKSKMNEEQINLIFELTPMNISARYPLYKDSIEKELTPEYCADLYDRTKELMKWIESKLS